ncbi:thioredoxin [Lutibacter agarilyticus]|uniref:Thioredoxin n=1 Tax=Lutibacter agarilyticus TaxID=1109740 RepID=A0A238VI15_9FLAO|nr:thioredoxin [Lutibacter agarilyticus]SNR34040.1 thioredoxin [Lutibacter agarilyticus]
MKKSFNEIVNEEIPVLVDFYADWCGPCKSMAPVLKQLKADLKDAVKIVKINVDTNQELAAKYKVRGVPTFMVFKKGKQTWRQSGMQSISQLKQAITSV